MDSTYEQLAERLSEALDANARLADEIDRLERERDGLRLYVDDLRRQQAGLPAPELRRCHAHTGEDCELCGGVGWRKKCDRSYCIEHGCDGGTYCAVTPQESAKLRHTEEPAHD